MNMAYDWVGYDSWQRNNWRAYVPSGTPCSCVGKYIGHLKPIDHGHPTSDRPRRTRSQTKLNKPSRARKPRSKKPPTPSRG